MYIFYLITCCERFVINTECSPTKPCSQIQLLSFHSVIFLVSATGSELDAKKQSGIPYLHLFVHPVLKLRYLL
jgi:hypothetical protein